ncbi:hypothetical protein J6590_020511 [Homalodisca vitripennis]|nr:hypothetical protein J6590_020511 [Homalodisca vitripennis]
MLASLLGIIYKELLPCGQMQLTVISLMMFILVSFTYLTKIGADGRKVPNWLFLGFEARYNQMDLNCNHRATNHIRSASMLGRVIPNRHRSQVYQSSEAGWGASTLTGSFTSTPKDALQVLLDLLPSDNGANALQSKCYPYFTEGAELCRDSVKLMNHRSVMINLLYLLAANM